MLVRSPFTSDFFRRGRPMVIIKPRNTDRPNVASSIIVWLMVTSAMVFTSATPRSGVAQATPDRSSPNAKPNARQPGVDPLGPGSVVVRRGWLWYSPQLLADPVQNADSSTVVALLKRFQTLVDGTNPGDDRPPRWVLLSVSYDPQQLSRRDVVEGISVQFPDSVSRPLIQAVPSRNPDGRALAGDAILVLEGESAAMRLVARHAGRVIPPDRDILFVSGRAARADDLGTAVTETMQSLFTTAGHFGSRPSDVVQVKAFIRPMEDAAAAARSIAQSFGESPAPSVTLSEWESSLPTEIEMVVAAPDREATDQTVTFHTPPGDRASPVFSRVARVHADTLIYFAGIVAPKAAEPVGEVESAFAQFDRLAGGHPTDFRHLVKATYYVSDDAVSAALNEVRPRLYDPSRPPAASKVAMPSVGIGRRGLLMDFIAVPASPRADGAP